MNKTYTPKWKNPNSEAAFYVHMCCELLRTIPKGEKTVRKKQIDAMIAGHRRFYNLLQIYRATEKGTAIDEALLKKIENSDPAAMKCITYKENESEEEE